MFTHKDIQHKSLFVINGTENQRLRVSVGRLLLENTKTGTVITKLPFPKILALIIVGHTTITTALIEFCNKYGIPIVVMKPNFRPVFYYGNMAEANYLLRQKQYENPKGNLESAKSLLINKISNQYRLIKRTKEKNTKTQSFFKTYENSLSTIKISNDLKSLMGIEGSISKQFFSAYYGFADWSNRGPRVKLDYLNATLDTGYTMLFNYIEAMTRLFGFDPYIGVYHQLWFKRKSLVCDLVEPFRCIIEHQIRKSLKYGSFKKEDFVLQKNSYYLKKEERTRYTKVFYEAIINHKSDIFIFLQQYYRCFMGRKSVLMYPNFKYE